VRKQEVPHNTAEQVRDYLAGALTIVDELELTGELRVPAFVKACDLLAAKQVLLEQVMPGGVDLAHIRHR
jgi:hypothetical protein